MIVIGFYTTDPVYQGAFDLLAMSMERVGMKHDFRAFPPDEWKNVTDLKPRIILESLEKYKEPVLYLDADAFVHEDLEAYFSQKSCDMAVNFIDRKDGSEQILAGTIYFDYNEKVIEFIKIWMQLLVDFPELHDQQTLQKAVEEFDHELDIFRLSSAFTYIFDKDYPDAQKPIIEHMQASREIYCRRRMKSLKSRIKDLLGLPNHKREMLQRRHDRVAELKRLIEQ